MKYLTRTEIKRLSGLCVERQLDDYKIIEDPNTSNMEKTLANCDREFWKSVQSKLDAIDQSKARRIEITI